MSYTGVLSATFYGDPQSMQRMRAAAQAQPEAGLRQAARQFEALFLQSVLQAARATQLAEGSPLSGEQVGLYRELHEQQLAVALAGQGRLGIADMIVRQLSYASSGATASEPDVVGRRIVPIAGDPVGAVVDRSRTPTQFVASFWPLARAAAVRLGVPAEAIVAHAALESGWGRSVPTRADGGSSYNLFGIKTGSQWPGSYVVRRTSEHIDGQFQERDERFRSYASLAEAIADYVTFLRDNPRYRDALDVGRDAQRFFSHLQQAGYATDPAYARKLVAVMHGPTFTRALATLQQADSQRIQVHQAERFAGSLNPSRIAQVASEDG